MKIILSCFLCLLNIIPLTLVSQGFPIGHRTMNFTDPMRNNRSVPCELYYPGADAGNNVPVASGAFPVISFGHGFLMAYDSYLYLKDSLVPRGYIMVFTKTEGGIAPDHLALGEDLAFLIIQMKTEGNSTTSPFFGHVDSTSAIMGHSMGGGASFLACENNQVPTAMVTFAAAETTPSAIHAAKQISQPSLVFAAEKDCVAPPAQNQVPMYDSLASDCKFFVNIKGGGHCYFADYNFQCSLGEVGCQQTFTITREEQHGITLDLLLPFLNYYLKKDASSWIVFNDTLESSTRITYLKSCTITGNPAPPIEASFLVFPNPVNDQVIVNSRVRNDLILGIKIHTLAGNLIYQKQAIDAIGDEKMIIDFSNFPCGIYLLEVEGKISNRIFKLVRD